MLLLEFFQKIVYATLVYLMYSVFMAIGQGPGEALIPAVTKNTDERLSMGQMGYFVIMIGAMSAQIAVVPLYKALGGGNDAKGFSLVMAGILIIGILLAVYQQINIKEKYIVHKSPDTDQLSIKELLAAVFSNRTAIITFLFILGLNLMSGIQSSASIYYFKYYFNNESLLSISGTVVIIPMMLGVMISPKVTKKIGLKNNLIISAIISILGSVLIVLLPPTSMGTTLYMVIGMATSFFQGISNPAQATMMPMAIDYTEWKTGHNINAFMSSFQGFFQTIATALSGVITAGMLGLIGYSAGAQQSEGTLLGLKFMISVLPAIGGIFMLSVIWFNLTEEKQNKMNQELEERRTIAEKN